MFSIYSAGGDPLGGGALIGADGSAVYSVIEPKLTLNANDVSKLIYTVPKTNPTYSNYSRYDSFVFAEYGDFGNNNIFYGIIKEVEEDVVSGLKKVTAYDSYYFFSSVTLPNKTYSGTKQSVFNSIISDYNSAAYYDIEQGNFSGSGSISIVSSNNTMKDVLKKFVDSAGGFFSITNKKLNYSSTGTEPSDNDIYPYAAVGRNIVSMVKRTSTTESYEIRAIDDYYITGEGRPWRIGDNVTVFDGSQELSVHPTITKIVISPDNPINNTVTLGIDSVVPISKR